MSVCNYIWVPWPFLCKRIEPNVTPSVSPSFGLVGYQTRCNGALPSRPFFATLFVFFLVGFVIPLFSEYKQSLGLPAPILLESIKQAVSIELFAVLLAIGWLPFFAFTLSRSPYKENQPNGCSPLKRHLRFFLLFTKAGLSVGAAAIGAICGISLAITFAVTFGISDDPGSSVQSAKTAVGLCLQLGSFWISSYFFHRVILAGPSSEGSCLLLQFMLWAVALFFALFFFIDQFGPLVYIFALFCTIIVLSLYSVCLKIP